MSAVIVNVYTPTGTVDATFSWSPVMLTPAGAPASVKLVGVVPVAVSVSAPPVPSTTDRLSALVIVGAITGTVTVSVKTCK